MNEARIDGTAVGDSRLRDGRDPARESARRGRRCTRCGLHYANDRRALRKAPSCSVWPAARSSSTLEYLKHARPVRQADRELPGAAASGRRRLHPGRACRPRASRDALEALDRARRARSAPRRAGSRRAARMRPYRSRAWRSSFTARSGTPTSTTSACTSSARSDLASWLGGVAAHRRRYSTCSRERRRSTRSGRGRSPSFRATPTGSGCPRPSSARWCAPSSRKHYPPHLPPHAVPRCTGTRSRTWYFTLSRQGWIAPAWPKAFGGMALPPDKLIAFIEEQRAVRRRAAARPGPHHARAAC